MAQELLQLSEIQHFAFCPRQWALIHIEQQWAENERTADGRIFHSRAHDGPSHELRGDTLILRGLRIFSERLGISVGDWLLMCSLCCCRAVSEMIWMNIRRLCGNESVWYPDAGRCFMLILITYDVNTTTPEGKRRLRQVAKKCVSHGTRVQNSVFECVLDNTQYKLLRNELEGLIDPHKDSLRFYTLGNNYQNKVTHIGAKTTYEIEGDLIL